ncbi:hypothetical protein [Arthrobacter sp. H35-D1]|uniref:hypothetical protein n=1 Tax=Arthrobacter sp. H35-D1 TaxID=3046202 RepID=UPI0024BA4BBC|nr:hypothetical protein [Arthrobacter sp. H35-D1]MDJ0312163.1 hypothetical protein [Arthrobacter sp. H35-D1]
MKSPLVSVGAATVLAASLLLAPGLSPAQAGTNDTSSTSTTSIMQGPVASTYGFGTLPCYLFGFRWC